MSQFYDRPRNKAEKEAYERLHGYGRADKKTFEALKPFLEKDNHVKITREKNGVIYFKIRGKVRSKE